MLKPLRGKFIAAEVQQDRQAEQAEEEEVEEEEEGAAVEAALVAAASAVEVEGTSPILWRVNAPSAEPKSKEPSTVETRMALLDCV